MDVSSSTAFDYEAVTVSTAAVGLTATKYRSADTGVDASEVYITVDGTAGTNDIRWTCDGTTPVAATTGHLLVAGQGITLIGYNNIKQFRAIRNGSADATLQVTYSR